MVAALLLGRILGSAALAQAPAPAVSAEAAQAQPVVQGWSRVEDSKEGFSIEIPSDWTTLNLDAESVEKLMAAYSRQHPEGAAWMEAQLPSLIAQGIKLLALEVSPTAMKLGYSASVNLLVQPVEVELPSSLFATTAKSALVQQGIVKKDAPIGKVSLGKMDASLLEYDLPMAGRDGESNLLHGRQVYLVQQGKVYVLTFTGLAQRDEVYRPIFERILQSITFGVPGSTPPPTVWKRCALGATGLSAELPAEPAAFDVASLRVEKEAELLGRLFLFFSLGEGSPAIGVIEGVYDERPSSRSVRQLVHQIGSSMAPALRGLEGDGDPQGVRDTLEEATALGRPGWRWTLEMDLAGGKVFLKGVAAAADHVLYVAAVECRKDDPESVATADRVLGSLALDGVAPENP